MKAPGTPYNAFQYLKGACRKVGGGLFRIACIDRTRGNGFKFKGDLAGSVPAQGKGG